MSKLYELTNELGQILHEIEELDGELPQELLERLDTVEIDLTNKVHGCCCVMKNLEARSAGLQAEIDRLTAARDAEARRKDWIKAYVKGCLEGVGHTKVETPLFKVRIQKNSRPTIRLDESAAIPEEFKRTKEEFDGDAAYKAWKAGKALPEEVKVIEGTHLRIS